MKQLRGRLIKGIAANVMGHVSGIVIQLVNVPIFLQTWGAVVYGEWLILTAIPTYFAMSDVGFANVAANEMTMKVVKGDRQQALEIFQSVCAFISAVCMAVMLCLTAVVWAIPIEEWLNIEQQSHTDVVIITLLLTLHVLTKLQGGMLAAGFRCEGNYAVGTLIGNVVRLLENLAIGAVALLGGSLKTAALVYLAVQVCGLLVMRYELKRRSPWIVYGFRHIKIKTIRNLAGSAIAFMGFPLGHALNNQGMITVVAATLGPVAVTVFSTLRTLSRLAFQLMNTINNTVWPEVSSAFGSGDLVLVRRLHHHACQVAIWGSNIAILGLWIFGEPLFAFWTKGEIVMDKNVFHIMLLTIFANSLWLTSSVVPAATNQHQRTALCFVVGTALSVASAVVLTQQWGLIGTAIAVLFTDLIMSVYVLKTSLSLVQDSVSSFLRIVLRPPSLRAFFSEPS